MDQTTRTAIGAKCPDENAKYRTSNHDEDNLQTVFSTKNDYAYIVCSLTLNGICNLSGGISSIGANHGSAFLAPAAKCRNATLTEEGKKYEETEKRRRVDVSRKRKSVCHEDESRTDKRPKDDLNSLASVHD